MHADCALVVLLCPKIVEERDFYILNRSQRFRPRAIPRIASRFTCAQAALCYLRETMHACMRTRDAEIRQRTTSFEDRKSAVSQREDRAQVAFSTSLPHAWNCPDYGVAFSPRSASNSNCCGSSFVGSAVGCWNCRVPFDRTAGSKKTSTNKQRSNPPWSQGYIRSEALEIL